MFTAITSKVKCFALRTSLQPEMTQWSTWQNAVKDLTSGMCDLHMGKSREIK